MSCICQIAIVLVVTSSSKSTAPVFVTKLVIIWASFPPTIPLWLKRLADYWTSIWKQSSDSSIWTVSLFFEHLLYPHFGFSRQFEKAPVSLSLHLQNRLSTLCGHCSADQVSRIESFCRIHVGPETEGVFDLAKHCIRRRTGRASFNFCFNLLL